MKSKLLLLFSLYGQFLLAQSFFEVMDTPFHGVRISAVAFADVDGDNDQDVLISGRDNSNDQINEKAKLYLNDGFGNYSEMMNTPFEGVVFGDITFGDFDHDEDQDVLITGLTNLDISIAKLYRNDGLGNFSEVTNVPFEGVHTSSTACVDVDNDGDLDIFIAGINDNIYGTAKLYLNDGAGNFTLATGTPFLGVVDAAIDFADIDGDNDQDVLITGTNSPAPSPSPTSNLYINDGAGNFSLMSGTPFQPAIAGAVAFADIDGDDDQDVLITGQNMGQTPNIAIAKLYTNDGSGNFSEVTGTPFEGVTLSSIAFADVDGDNDQDVLITGRSGTNFPFTEISKLYTNNGLGQFSEAIGEPFEAVAFSAIAFADVDGDNDQDVLITGWIAGTPSTGISKLYLNENMVSSTEEVFTGLEFSLFPNPSGVNEVNLSFTSKENSSVKINVFDLNGRVLKEFSEQIKTGAQTIVLDVSSFKKGCYFVSLNDGNKKWVRKLILL